MKKLLIGLVAVMCLMGVVGVAYGNSGSAIIPHWMVAGTNPNSSIIFISNITNEPINVKVILYKNDGTLFIDGDNNPGSGTMRTSGSVTNYNDNPGKSSVSFTLAATSTAYIYASTSTR